jgi:predicted cation transporter
MSSSLPKDADLAAFLREAKQKGLSDEILVALLRQNGWSERRIFRAYSSFYADLLGTPIPVRGQASENARDAFLYLLNFITLGFWTVALGRVFYTLIAHWFPDPTQPFLYYRSLRDEIAWQVAIVIVAFPVFAFVHTVIGRELQTRPDLYQSGVRKWLTYLALVIAAIVVLTDAAWFIQALITGELTLRFVLDSLVLLVLGGGVLAYYLSTIEPPPSRA